MAANELVTRTHGCVPRLTVFRTAIIPGSFRAKEFIIMAKPSKNKNGKNGSNGRKSSPAPAPSRVVKTSAVRNTPIPKQTRARRTIADGAGAASVKSITHAMIAERAYFISQSGNAGSEHENWMRAERELRGI